MTQSNGFDFTLFKQVMRLKFKQNELAQLYGRTRQSIWAWAQYAESRGSRGSMPVDPVLCEMYNRTSQRILRHVAANPIPALDSLDRAAYVNNLAAELKKH